jgi:hypothetical protein
MVIWDVASVEEVVAEVVGLPVVALRYECDVLWLLLQPPPPLLVL